MLLVSTYVPISNDPTPECLLKSSQETSHVLVLLPGQNHLVNQKNSRPNLHKKLKRPSPEKRHLIQVKHSRAFKKQAGATVEKRRLFLTVDFVHRWCNVHIRQPRQSWFYKHQPTSTSFPTKVSLWKPYKLRQRWRAVSALPQPQSHFFGP